jgi:hypothetical protein
MCESHSIAAEAVVVTEPNRYATRFANVFFDQYEDWRPGRVPDLCVL